MHFMPIIGHQTNIGLGDCSYLDTCKGKGQCKYVHYNTECPAIMNSNLSMYPKSLNKAEWIN